MVLTVFSLAAAFGCSVVGGVMFAFSAFVMPGLVRAPSPAGMTAMQAINVAAVRPPFMIVLFGTALLTVAAPIVAFATGQPVGWLMAGGSLYLVGVIGLTVGFHMPRNNSLAAVDPSGAESPKPWERYVAEWVPWNHVRALAALAASGCFVVALIAR